MTDAAELQKEHGIEGLARFADRPHGLTVLEITSPAGTAEIYPHGGHVTHWQPAGQEPVLFLSGSSWFEPGKPIRGGIPLCWPWFGPSDELPDAPAHGLARLSEWTVQAVRPGCDSGVSVSLSLEPDERARALWPHPFRLELTVTVGPALSVELTTRNTGSRPMTITEALHTYLAVGDARRATVTGLGGVEYLDKMDGGARKRQSDESIDFTAETDRVYLDTTGPCTLDDPAGGRRIRVEKSGSRSTVVWNPWIDKAGRMPDFGDDEWLRMVCIETANAHDNAVTIEPGQSHAIATTVSVL